MHFLFKIILGYNFKTSKLSNNIFKIIINYVSF